MENRNFIPYESFGVIHFGESITDVRKKLNSPFEQVFFSEESKRFRDFFNDFSLKIEYDSNNTLLSIEAWYDANKSFYFLGKNLMQLTLKELELFLKENDDAVEQFSIGYFSPKFGISICSDSLEEVEPASSFYLVRKDYMTIEK